MTRKWASIWITIFMKNWENICLIVQQILKWILTWKDQMHLELVCLLPLVGRSPPRCKAIALTHVLLYAIGRQLTQLIYIDFKEKFTFTFKFFIQLKPTNLKRKGYRTAWQVSQHKWMLLYTIGVLFEDVCLHRKWTTFYDLLILACFSSILWLTSSHFDHFSYFFPSLYLSFFCFVHDFVLLGC